ncbi:MAG: hypothetical protein IJ568_05190 [Bacilli bacterium]|nr:hypothetical protein [Bacilli bacterium]
MDEMEMEKIDEVSLDSLSNESILEEFKEVDAFLKVVEEEIKRTDIGDSDE